MQPEFEKILFEDGSFLPASRILSRREIKNTISRRVAEVDLKGPPPIPLIVKTYLARRGVDDFLRGRVFPSPAEIEMRHALKILERGVEVAEPVAFGNRPAGFLSCESFLVVRRFVGARELDAVLRGGRISHMERLRFINTLAGLFRRLHDAGIIHRDPHLQNLLLAGSPEEPRLYLIDLRRIRTFNKIKTDRRIQNLAFLWIASRGFASRGDRRRFLDAYLGEEIPPPVRSVFRQKVEAASSSLLRRIAFVRAKKALRTNRKFQRRVIGPVRWHIRNQDASEELEILLNEPEAVFRNPANLLKSGRASTVARQGRMVVKRFNPKRKRMLLFDRLRRARARRNFSRAILLETLGIPTARVVAAGERRLHGFVTGGYLITREVPEAKTILQYAGESPSGLPIVKAAGRLIARLHEARLAHRDLKATNFLVDSRDRLHMIDLDGLRAVRNVSPRRAASDLVRFIRDLFETTETYWKAAQLVLDAYCVSRRMEPKESFELVELVRRGIAKFDPQNLRKEDFLWE